MSTTISQGLPASVREPRIIVVPYAIVGYNFIAGVNRRTIEFVVASACADVRTVIAPSAVFAS